MMSFEVIIEGESHGFVQLRKKLYKRGDEQRMML